MSNRSMIGDTTKPGQVVLLLDEIRLLADALRSVGPRLEHCPEYLDQLCGGRDGPVGDNILAHLVEAAVMDEALDIKWDVEVEDVLSKIQCLSEEARRKIVLTIVEFWERDSDRRAEELLHWVLDEINSTNKKQTESISVCSKPEEL